MIRKDCDDCIKRETMYCPNSNECYCTFEKPYHLDNLKALNQLQQKDNIIKEARKYINNHQLVFELSSKKQIADWFDMFYKELLEILDKENK